MSLTTADYGNVVGDLPTAEQRSKEMSPMARPDPARRDAVLPVRGREAGAW